MDKEFSGTKLSNEDENSNKPSPSDFDEYIPWACNQLQIDGIVIITRVVQNEYVSLAVTDRSKSKKKKAGQSYMELGSDHGKEDKSTSAHLQTFTAEDNIIRISTTYDNCDNLVQIKFDQNKNVPRKVLKIIGLIVKFHLYLYNITINKGLDKYSLYEICKFLPLSHITDVCLDGTYLEHPNYCILLESASFLRYLSLSRCKIDDVALKKIAENLAYPLPSSKTLSVLNLATNRITDKGVKHLAEALRSNRHLAYLNLADNMITDEGASAILDILKEFPMSVDELLRSRQRRMQYLQEKKELIAKYVMELRYMDDRKFIKRKTARPSSFPTKKGKGVEKEPSFKSLNEATKSLMNFDTGLFEKAENMAMTALGPFSDPFSTTNTISKDGVVYSCGNNYVSYLNLSYNDLSYFSVKKLLCVLVYQKQLNKRPRGLVNVCIEGNCLPISCKEMYQIDEILEMGLMALRRYSVVGKKKPSTKSGK